MARAHKDPYLPKCKTDSGSTPLYFPVYFVTRSFRDVMAPSVSSFSTQYEQGASWDPQMLP